MVVEKLVPCRRCGKILVHTVERLLGACTLCMKKDSDVKAGTRQPKYRNRRY